MVCPCADPEEVTGGPDPPWKITKIRGFLALLTRSPKITKPALNVGPSSAHMKNAILMVFLWWGQCVKQSCLNDYFSISIS